MGYVYVLFTLMESVFPQNALIYPVKFYSYFQTNFNAISTLASSDVSHANEHIYQRGIFHHNVKGFNFPFPERQKAIHIWNFKSYHWLSKVEHILFIFITSI